MPCTRLLPLLLASLYFLVPFLFLPRWHSPPVLALQASPCGASWLLSMKEFPLSSKNIPLPATLTLLQATLPPLWFTRRVMPACDKRGQDPTEPVLRRFGTARWRRRWHAHCPLWRRSVSARQANPHDLSHHHLSGSQPGRADCTCVDVCLCVRLSAQTPSSKTSRRRAWQAAPCRAPPARPSVQRGGDAAPRQHSAPRPPAQPRTRRTRARQQSARARPPA